MSSGGMDTSPEPEGDSAGSGPPGTEPKKRRRRTVLPRTPAGKRCGHCHTCLNPQFKKACETRRAELMQASGVTPAAPWPGSAGSGVPAAARAPGAGDAADAKRRKLAPADYSDLDAAPSAVPVPAAPAAPAAPPAVDDPFTRELGVITLRSGGLRDPKFVPRLERLMTGSDSLNARILLLTIIAKSPRPCLLPLVHGRGLGILEEWLVEGRDANKPRFMLKVLETLKGLPVDLKALKTCSIGKTMAKISKKGPPELHEAAGALVAVWKKAVEADQGPAGEQGVKREGCVLLLG
jgi:hypothetical protein